MIYPTKGKAVRLVTFMAKACHYAEAMHIDDNSAWSTDPAHREAYLQCVSYQMACFFAQNTPLGNEGVDWNVVLAELVALPMKTEKQWERILNRVAKKLGGWKEAEDVSKS
ncbi:MAG: hypothetical protein JW388_0974 [Nitrospira sp.]|nr:hypothetical protein [Nitrospira sp.]